MNTAFVSFSAMSVSPLSPVRLKLATLLFDRVYFMHEESDNWDAKIAALFGNEDNLSFPVLSSLRTVWECTNPQKNGYDLIYSLRSDAELKSIPVPLKNATDAVVQARENEHPYEKYKLGVYSLSEILWWQKNYPDSTLMAADFVEEIVSQASFNTDQSTGAGQIAECQVPDIAALSFADIVSLRGSDYLSNFRAKYHELSARNEVNELLKHYQAAMEKLVDEVKPHAGIEVAKGVLGNLPIPFVNPFGIAATFNDIRTAVKRKQNYGWMYFLREMKAKLIQNPKP